MATLQQGKHTCNQMNSGLSLGSKCAVSMDSSGLEDGQIDDSRVEAMGHVFRDVPSILKTLQMIADCVLFWCATFKICS